MENARRSLIDSYLLEAIDFTFDENNYNPLKDKLAIYPEYYIKPVHVNKKIKLTGSIDYISACRREPGFGMKIKIFLIISSTLLFSNNIIIFPSFPSAGLNKGTSIAVNPVFCTIEAKRDERFSSGKGETLGQMLSLYNKNRYVLNNLKSFSPIKL